MERHAGDSAKSHAGAATRVQFKAPQPVVFVPYRLAAECGLLLVLASWVLTMLSWYTSRVSPSCTPPHVHSGVGRSPVAIVARDSALAWMVDERGLVHMAPREADEASAPPSRQAFHLEWQQKRDDLTPGNGAHFCLRWLRDMRLVAVAKPGSEHENMLMLSGRYSCDERGAFFAFRGSSLYSIGAESFVNYREHWHVRAHGDIGPPWKPLLMETPRTRVSIEPLPDRRDYVERSLLDLVTRLEHNATAATAARAGGPPAR